MPAMPMRDDYGVSLFAAVLFGIATAINHGHWSGDAFAFVVAAFALLAWHFANAMRLRGGARGGVRPLVGPRLVLVLLLTLPITALLDATLIPEPAVHRWTLGRAGQLLSLVLIASYAPFLSGARREPAQWRTARFLAFAFLLCVAGIAVIRLDTTPKIDVWTLQTSGVEVLLDGSNPYASVAVPDTDPESDFTVPYVYPPFVIYAGVIGRLLGGDVRYSLLAAMLVTGIALRSIARRGANRDGAGTLPSLFEDAPALFFWQTPPLFFVLDRSWVDPLQVMLISLVVAAHVAKKRTLAAALLGLAISSKQSMFWLIPLALVLRFDLRRWVVMTIAAVLPVAPFALWDFGALKYANFDVMVKLAPRHDSLCFGAWFARVFDARFPTQVGFILAAGTVGVACVRTPLDAAERWRAAPLSFARAVLVTYFAFFFFNRWAFANYYFLLIGLAALVASAAVHSDAGRDQPIGL